MKRALPLFAALIFVASTLVSCGSATPDTSALTEYTGDIGNRQIVNHSDYYVSIALAGRVTTPAGGGISNVEHFSIGWYNVAPKTTMFFREITASLRNEANLAPNQTLELLGHKAMFYNPYTNKYGDVFTYYDQGNRVFPVPETTEQNANNVYPVFALSRRSDSFFMRFASRGVTNEQTAQMFAAKGWAISPYDQIRAGVNNLHVAPTQSDLDSIKAFMDEGRPADPVAGPVIGQTVIRNDTTVPVAFYARSTTGAAYKEYTVQPGVLVTLTAVSMPIEFRVQFDADTTAISQITEINLNVNGFYRFVLAGNNLSLVAN